MHFVGGALLGVVLVVVRSRQARRRREELRLGAAVRCAARLAMGGDRLRRGRLELSGTEATWRDHRGARQVALDGARVLSAVGAGGRTAQPEDVVVRLVLPWQATARLQLHRDDAATLIEVLEAGAAEPAGPGRLAVASGTGRRPWWSVACLGVAGAWLLGWAWLLAGGELATATVTAGDGAGLCQVAWTSGDGRNERATVDCADDPVGAAHTVWAVAPPFRGAAVDAGLTSLAGFVLLPALLVGVPGAVRLGVLSRRQPVLGAPPVPVTYRDLPELSDDDLFLAPGEQPAAVVARLAPYARRQVPEDGWEDPRRPDGVRGPLTPARVGWTLIGPAGALVVAVTWLDSALGIGGLLLAALWAASAGGSVVGHVRRVHLAHREPPRPLLGLLTSGEEGGPVALVCDPAAAPVRFFAVPLDTPLPHGTAASCTAGDGVVVSVRGPLTDGGTVVLELPGAGRPLMPNGPVTEPDEWTLLSVLDSAGALTLAAEADDDRDDAWDDGWDDSRDEGPDPRR